MTYFEFFPISVSGLIVAFLLFVITESLKRPYLGFKIKEEPIFEKDIKDKKRKIRFINIEVSNKKLPWLVRYFGKTANNSRAFLSFRDPSSRKELLRLNARWYTGKEPVDYIGQKVDVGLALIPQREVIPPDEVGGVGVAIKFEGDEHFYAFTNESYLHNDDWRPWGWVRYKLTKDHYLLCLEVKAEGHTYSQEFLLKNPSTTLDDFGLDYLKQNNC